MIAAYASFSESKTRAGPRNASMSLPESFMTADSDARDPRKQTI